MENMGKFVWPIGWCLNFRFQTLRWPRWDLFKMCFCGKDGLDASFETVEER